MPDPIPEWTDSSDVPVGAAEIHAFGKVGPGGEGTAITRRLWNGRSATVDTLTDVVIVAQARIQGDSEWKTSGIDLLDRRALSVRASAIPELASFRPLGEGLWIQVPDILTGEFVEFDIKPVMPAGSPDVVTEFRLAVARILFQTISHGLSTTPGIYRGIGRGAQPYNTAVFSRSAALSVSGTGASSALVWPDMVHYEAGVPFSRLTESVTLSNSAADGAMTTTGESYIFLVTLEDGARTITKSNKGIGLAYPADAPATPAGTDILLGWGERFYDTDALAPTVAELAGATPKFFEVSTSGLNWTVRGGGGALVGGGRLVSPSTDRTSPLTASATNTVQVLPDGTFTATTDGSRAAPSAQILADITTDGSGETSRIERRRWADPGFPIVAHFDAPSDGDEVRWQHMSTETLRIRPDQAIGRISTVSGFTTGSILFDAFRKPVDGAEVTLFTSFATDDRRWSWAFNAASERVDAVPEVVTIEPGDEIIFRCTQVSDTEPEHAVVTLWVDAE